MLKGLSDKNKNTEDTEKHRGGETKEQGTIKKDKSRGFNTSLVATRLDC